MLCRTGFFFTKNAVVLNTLAQSKVSRLSIAPRAKFSLSQMFSRITRSTRSYSTIPANANVQSPILNSVKASTISVSKPGPTVISHKYVGYWLLATSGLVFGIVVLGGLTRLTESGLSITEWKPITGAIPPMNQKEWEEEFDKYKSSPEFQQLNSHITLEEFKFIFKMEWAHRLMGRAIGMFFVLPALYFWKSGKMSTHVSKRVLGLTGLLGLQGAIGWWMVKSGLDEESLAERKSKPTVSQYRLTTHLAAAFLLYLGVLSTGFEILTENKWLKNANKPEMFQNIIEKLNNPALRKIAPFRFALLGLAFATAMSGGMVAGLDAGLIYNTFPHMGDDIVPSVNELMSPVYARKADQSDLWWRNLLENPTTVQLVHRILATTVFFTVAGTYLFCSRNKAMFPKATLKRAHGIMGLVTLQVALGITTLIYLVPIPLGSAHQAGALALLTGCLAFSASLRKPRPAAVSYINQAMKNQLLKKN
ncbi:COX15-CtaA-domain-containing protein [Suhomyces tanzawaensis NRRL Y-17324]|uniref:COX15-CtaA-domain-containing protein n=1 Tax=Suhomyces tanzawaensis NRRL Y-17324 TaxID=984487 RepID=A0A1E4SQU9_9ASCO|nr:COX15-CtaA-domain-containing protein [Suhomyces tanzawaensis NRRL Y-17324]ODV81817.1 COX15-CtaA-domain-containing protein [Suhomyces tanzawaensis NRRL Y-17324]